MARKDYYLILGISRGENLHGIQQAFRHLAKRYHPDRAGDDATHKFQDIQEAYEVLSDPTRRRVYNHELERDEVRLREYPTFFRGPIAPEPLIPERRSVLHDYETIQPGFEPLYERFARNFTDRGVPKSEGLEGLNIDVTLYRDEALTGVVVPLAIPTFYACPDCGGSGREWLFPCFNCQAQGIIEDQRTVNVHIPPLVQDRTIIEVPIQRLGIHNFFLRLHIRIAPSW
ncbi:MAG TPA: DnaJ domain-containing protein [Candidatus Binatia bacterium]|jgi:hypothetical protein